MLNKARFSRRLHQFAPMIQTLFESLAADCEANNPYQLYAIDSYSIAVCGPIRASRARLHQGESWQGG